MSTHKRIGAILVCTAKGVCNSTVYLRDEYNDTCQVTVISSNESGATEYHVSCDKGEIDKTFRSDSELEAFINEHFVEISSQVCPDCRDLYCITEKQKFTGSCCECGYDLGETDCNHLHCPKCNKCVGVILKPR